MASFITRNGVSRLADEVFEAWTSGNLSRMLAARGLATHPVDRHFLLQSIVGLTYRDRAQPEMREICLQTSFQHIAEFKDIAPDLAAASGGRLPRVPTFSTLAALLVEERRFPEAIAICEQALQHGLHDGTKGDFPARIERIRKTAAKTAKASARAV